MRRENSEKTGKNKVRPIRKVGLFFTFIICLLLLNNTSLLALEKENNNFGKNLILRQERFQANGVLISRPSPIDERMRDIIVYKKFRCLEDYVLWLKENVKYKSDEGKDDWAAPEDTLRRKKGDCEDFAFLNEATLRLLGYQPKVIAVMRPFRSHAICIFQENGYYLIIDNNRLIRTQTKTMPELAKYVFKKYSCASICEIDLKTKEKNVLFEVSDISNQEM